jgi:hypothetical protein
MSSPLFISSSESLLTRSFLPRYLLEHGLKADGRIDADAAQEAGDAGSYETFFSETANGKYVPRSIFVDLDPSVGSLGTHRCIETIADFQSPLTRSAPVLTASSSTPRC